MSRARRLGAALVAAGLACNDGLAPIPAPTSCPPGFVGICGTVTFRGAIPESTDVVYVVAYDTFPQGPDDLFDFVPLLPPTLPLGGSATFYTLPVPEGRYEWVLAVWKKQGQLTISNADSLLREAGFFRDPADTTRAGVVAVSGIGTDEIDFVVDFDMMHPVSYWFPMPPQPR